MRPVVALLILTLGLTLGVAAPVSKPTRLLDGPYVLEVEVSFHRALLHWIDSLTGVDAPGMTAGKTWLAHRAEYQQRLGDPSKEDVQWLERYLRARAAYIAARPKDDHLDLTSAFYAAPDLDTAIERALAQLPEDARADFAGAVRHFAPKYETLWRGGVAASRFLERARADRDRLRRLSRFLARVSRFYGVDPAEATPSLVVVPVQQGHGTHAQAVGRFLLIEVRPGEGLAEQIAPIVHENAHFLYLRASESRREELAARARAQSTSGGAAWAFLREALPTAIGQGVADSRFGTRHWSLERPWYHEERIDAYAKRIYPLVLRALDSSAVLDERLLGELVAAYESSVSGS